MVRAGAEAPTSPIVGTARTGAVTVENPPSGVNCADLLTLNFVAGTNFAAASVETVQQLPEPQLITT